LRNRLTIAVLTLVVLALLTGHFVIGMDYMEQRRGHQELNALIAEAVQLRTQADAPDLQAELAAAEAELVAAQHAFPAGLNSTSLINDILLLADDCGVSAIPLVTQPWGEVAVGHDYEVFRISLTVTGGFADLYTFVYRLESSEFASLTTEDLSVTRLEDEETGNSIPVKASLDVAIYSQPPTAEGAAPDG
jgi:hypothetical protein